MNKNGNCAQGSFTSRIARPAPVRGLPLKAKIMAAYTGNGAEHFFVVTNTWKLYVDLYGCI